MSSLKENDVSRHSSTGVNKSKIPLAPDRKKGSKGKPKRPLPPKTIPPNSLREDRSDGVEEVPQYFITPTLRQELQKLTPSTQEGEDEPNLFLEMKMEHYEAKPTFDFHCTKDSQHDQHEDNVKIVQYVQSQWDENNNLIDGNLLEAELSPKVLPQIEVTPSTFPPIEVTPSILPPAPVEVTAETIATLPEELPKTKRVGTLKECPIYSVLQMGGDVNMDFEQIIPKYPDKQFNSSPLPSRYFDFKYYKPVLSSHVYKWNIPAEVVNKGQVKNFEFTSELDEEETIPEEEIIQQQLTIIPEEESPFEVDEFPPIVDPISGPAVLEDISLNNFAYQEPSDLDNWNYPPPEDIIEAATHNACEGCPYIAVPSDYVHDQDEIRVLRSLHSESDFMTDFLRAIIPDQFESEILANAFDFGSKLVNAGLQLATSIIGDETDLEPREDICKYNGYRIRCSGRSILLEGIYLNCHLHHRGPQFDTRLEELEAGFRIRILVHLVNASVPLSTEHGYHSDMEHHLDVLEDKWTFHYGPSTEFENSFVEIEVPAGLSPCLIRHTFLADGILLIEAP